MAKHHLHDADLKALTEVCSTGMEHAAIALSQLMGKGVDIQVPRLQVLEGCNVSHLLDAHDVTALHLQILGNIRGSILILLRRENAQRILELLLGELPAQGEPLSEMERATLMEVGNILASACLNALGNTLKMTLLPSVPTLMTGKGCEVFARAMERGGDDEAVVMIDAVFSVSDSLCGGSIFLIPAPASLGAMLGALEQ
jgi:chemotaxis protein CheC